MSQKEQLIKIIDKYWIRRGWIETDESILDTRPLTASEELISDILNLLNGIPNDDDIEDMADKKYPCYDEDGDRITDLNEGFLDGAKWMRGEIIKRNKQS
jgi:hypothetical protein